MTGRWPLLPALFCGVMVFSAGACNAGTTELDFSVDTTSASSASVLTPRTVESRRWLQPPVRRGFGLPDTAVVAAFARFGANALFVPDITVSIDSLTVTPRDIALVTPSGAVSLFRRASDLGLNDSVSIDALAISSNGLDVYFSIDGAGSVSGLAVGSADILRAGPSSIVVHRSAASIGIPPAANLGALEVDADGGLLGVFDLPLESGTEYIPAGAIAEYLPNSNRWVVSRKVSDLGYACTGCGFSAIAAVISSDLVFRSGAEQNEL